MRAIDVNEHLVGELGAAEGRTTRLTCRDTFLLMADLGVYPHEFAERIAQSAGLRDVLVHDYDGAGRRIVHGAIRSCLENYQRYLESVRSFLDRLPDGRGR